MAKKYLTTKSGQRIYPATLKELILTEENGVLEPTDLVEKSDLKEINDNITTLNQDKADRATYATGQGGLVQHDVLTILEAYDNYEGKIIEFYANEVAPDKLVSIGWVMKQLDNEPVLIEIDRDGHSIKWTKTANYNANEGITYKEI